MPLPLPFQEGLPPVQFLVGFVHRWGSGALAAVRFVFFVVVFEDTAEMIEVQYLALYGKFDTE